MNVINSGTPADMDITLQHAEKAANHVPPLWPLASSVAVNPYLGQSGETLAETGTRLARVAGLRSTMPRSWFAECISNGSITSADLEAALHAAPANRRPKDVAALVNAANTPVPEPIAIPTVADLVRNRTCTDWPGFVAERFGAWAASYFDEGQALWRFARLKSAFGDWKDHASRDLTPEIAGLTDFCRFVDEFPANRPDAMEKAVSVLGLKDAEMSSYFHALLMTLGGWAQLARYRSWQAELDGGTDGTIVDLLAIRLVWEAALLERHREAIEADWQAARARHAQPVQADECLVIDAILQEAAERAEQRLLAETMSAPVEPRVDPSRPAFQAAFCIDVRSEIFRRALEAVDPDIETLGFAGFFGLPVSHRRLASDVQEAHLPVLLKPGVQSHAEDVGHADIARRYRLRAKRAWGRFRLAAVSSFAFVEAAGPIYAGRMLRDMFGIPSKRVSAEPRPVLDPEPDIAEKITTAETILRAMSLTANFAPVVMLAGHGANVVNNPHSSALHCGACGGYSGEVNARLLAALLNEGEVREGLHKRGIEIPEDTHFVGALHDTTTDRVTLYDRDHPSPGHAEKLATIRDWLDKAGKETRAERALRLPRAAHQDQIFRRSRDWAEIRPEWALAGCNKFIAAPRHRTAGRDLTGSAFLHNYDWQADSRNGYSVLELIMTAPVVVASWISLQYYGSTVAPEAFGAGNKLLHNVTGGIGVVEGNGGVLRTGLPWQSIHDGRQFRHDPLRLSVLIEAPREAMTDILSRHDGVRELFDNRWLHLFALDEQGRMAWRYKDGLEWEAEQCSDVMNDRAVA